MNFRSLKPSTLILAAFGMTACNYTQVYELPATGDAGLPDASVVAITDDAGSGCFGASNLASDPQNCGACGHSCLGGACSAGRCQPIILASNQGDSSWPGFTGVGGEPLEGPDRLAVDGTHVYWLNLRGEVNRVPIGGGAPELVATTARSPAWIVLDDSYVYYSTLTGYIFRVAKQAGSTPEIFASPPAPRRAITLLSHGAYPTELSIIGDRLYWADGGGAYACPTAGCAGAPEVLNAGDKEYRPFSFAIDASGNRYSSIELHRATGPSSESVSWGLAEFRDGNWLGTSTAPAYYELRGDSDGVYAFIMTDFGAIGVVRYRWQDSAVVFLASGLKPSPRGLTLDSRYVYWVNSPEPKVDLRERTATIARCAKTGCASPEELAGGQIVPRAVAVSKDAVYWTTGDGNVMKLAKPEDGKGLP